MFLPIGRGSACLIIALRSVYRMQSYPRGQHRGSPAEKYSTQQLREVSFDLQPLLCDKKLDRNMGILILFFVGGNVPVGRLRWGTERRFEFIELRLFWNGIVNRQELAGTFGISLQQASADFARYLDIAPGNAAYNRAANGYVRSGAFRSRFTTPDAVRHLSHLRLTSEGMLDPGFPGSGQIPSFDIVPGPVSRIDPLVLRSILDAIRGRQEIEITYQSTLRAEPGRWCIAPHALAFDGFRWHARACCAGDKTFKHFTLARMSSPGDPRPTDIDSATDKLWHQRVRTIIGPHPRLSEGQRKAVEADYGMTGGVSVTDVRASFLWYFLKRLGIEGDAAGKPPQDQHIVLLNRNEVMAALFAQDEA